MRVIFKNIQGLRFLAFLLIFLNHSYFIVTRHKLFDFGARGVELFFLMSGFLMAFHYGKKGIESSWTASLKYACQKAKKFYALHLATFGTMAAFFLYKYFAHGTIYSGGAYGCIRDVLLNLTLLKSWYFPSAFSFNGVTWFLSTLLFIYLLFPKTATFFREKSRQDIGLAFCLVLFLKLALDICFSQKWIVLYPGFSTYTNPLYRYLDFLLGYVSFFLLYSESRKPAVFVNWMQGVMLVAYFGCCYFFDGLWAQVPFILAGILLIYAISLSGGFLDGLLGNKIMTHLGDISLELFMVHQVIIEILRWKILKIVNGGLTVLILFLLSILAAEIIHRRKLFFFLKSR